MGIEPVDVAIGRGHLDVEELAGLFDDRVDHVSLVLPALEQLAPPMRPTPRSPSLLGHGNGVDHVYNPASIPLEAGFQTFDR